jgi:hypothetical protein
LTTESLKQYSQYEIGTIFSPFALNEEEHGLYEYIIFQMTNSCNEHTWQNISSQQITTSVI